MTIKMPHIVKLDNDKAAAAFIAGKAASADNVGRAVVNMRFDPALLARIDAAARAQGISRTAWLHVAASKALTGPVT
jgi:hypothetical protein